MVLFITTPSAPNNFIAMLSAALVTILAIIAGTFLMLVERFGNDLEIEMRPLMTFFNYMGLTTVTALWLAFLVVLGMYYASRKDEAISNVLIAALIAGGYFFLAFAACAVHLFFTGIKSVS